MAGVAEKETGNQAFAKGDWEKAISWYTLAIVANPSEATFYSNRSAARHKAGHFISASEDALQCIKLRPEWHKGHFRLGEAYFSRGLFRKACDAFGAAQLIDPNDTTIRDALAKAARAEVERKLSEPLPSSDGGRRGSRPTRSPNKRSRSSSRDCELLDRKRKQERERIRNQQNQNMELARERHRLENLKAVELERAKKRERERVEQVRARERDHSRDDVRARVDVRDLEKELEHARRQADLRALERAREEEMERQRLENLQARLQEEKLSSRQRILEEERERQRLVNLAREKEIDAIREAERQRLLSLNRDVGGDRDSVHRKLVADQARSNLAHGRPTVDSFLQQPDGPAGFLFCPSCGAEVTIPDAAFCLMCGEDFRAFRNACKL
eukprot:NODE_3134_length_1274_cov_39.275413_g2975_i0.p1 GENE.NODE_3134_length_1274_cov_39.275413_g2975_i0~~NODE_3134_length_1274_cov_39.275413_g2975_i0.p1  ORF type:complete len:387 (+),score=39.79 NODE_3134_length_1274_cov_39.275413_g2975_i0:61-1221(+)